VKDWVSGEEVNYTYDSLNRLTQAATTGPQWGLSYTYDGFGNLWNQTLTKGSGPTTNLAYNPYINRLWMAGYSYDHAGNLTQTPNLTLTYNEKNQLVQAAPWSGGTEQYGYDPRGQRLWTTQSAQPNTWYLSFYGPDGRRIADCTASGDGSAYNPFGANCTYQSVYFGGKLVRNQWPWVDAEGRVRVTGASRAEDRLGSQGRHYPYGENQPGSTSSKFATYDMDSATGLHYANQRFYSTAIARFMTADPYMASAQAENPQSWNRYAYVDNDPVNHQDPVGTFSCLVGVGEGAELTNCDIVTFNTVKRIVREPTSTGPELTGTASKLQKAQFRSSAKRAGSKLKGDCAGLFGKGALSTLNAATYEYGVSYTSGTANPDSAIYASTNVETQTVTINMIGHFFRVRENVTDPHTNQPAVAIYDMGTGLSDGECRAFVLLHELGHLTGVLGDDVKEPGLSDAFNKNIMKDCFGKDWNPPPPQP